VRDTIGRWTKQDPQAVAEFVGSLEDVELRRSATSSMVTSLSQSDPFAALAFIRSQDSDEKGDQMANLLLSTASNDYQTAIQIYEDYLPPPSEGDINGKFSSALISMVTSWGRHDPEAAANWALSFPDGDTRNNAVANLARAWVKQDASVVSEWISKLPKGPARDHAILPLISVIRHGDPEAAFTWAFAVSEKRKRNGALLAVVRPWMEKDPEAAAFAVESADLLQGMVADLLLNR
jgi:hypothetical protein